MLGEIGLDPQASTRCSRVVCNCVLLCDGLVAALKIRRLSYQADSKERARARSRLFEYLQGPVTLSINMGI